MRFAPQRRLALVLSAAIAGSIMWAAPARAATTILVNTQEDEANTDGDCSLREALNVTGFRAPTDACPSQTSGTGNPTIIQIPSGYVITLATAGSGTADENLNATGDLDVTHGVEIQGLGPVQPIVQGGTSAATGMDRVFHVPQAAVVVFENLTIRHGRSDSTTTSASPRGGGIYSKGTVTVRDSLITDNTTSGPGGGLSGEVTLNLDNTDVTSNHSDDSGGGIFFAGNNLTLTDSAVSENDTDSFGGGIRLNLGNAFITDSTIQDNTAASGGGGIYHASINPGRLEISGTTLDGNDTGTSGSGGALSTVNNTITFISESTISNNNALQGAGLHNVGGGVDVSDTTITGNDTYTGSPSNLGGGIYTSTGTHTGIMQVHTSLIHDNEADASGGGIFHSSGSLTVSNSTLSGNSAGFHGGGLSSSATGSLTNVTVAGNHGNVNGQGIGQGGGIRAAGTSGSLGLKNTIVADNDLGGAAAANGHDCSSSNGITSQGNILVEQISGCTFFSSGADITGQDPALRPLGDNGGPTETYAPKTGSPVVDKGTNTGCPSTDQRGETRPIDGGDADATATCDIGSVELQTDEMNLLSIDDKSIDEGNSGTTNFVFTVTLSPAINEPVTVQYATSNGTASSSSDYTSTSGPLTFNANDTSETITVPVSGDTTFEDDETFFVDLSNASVNAGFSDARGVGTIENDDVDPCIATPTGDNCDPDNDDIPNVNDDCENEAEDVDGFEDTNGCPDPDNDQDTVLDGPDQCDDTAEDLDLFEDSDGCPDPDNDADTVLDVDETCDNDPEDMDGFEDSDGCPDPDNDADGIPDTTDVCDNLDEDPDGKQDGDGCPDQVKQTSVSIAYKARRDVVKGGVTTTPDFPRCERDRGIKLFRKKPGPDALKGSENTNQRGRYSFDIGPGLHGNVYTRAAKKTVTKDNGTIVTCPAKSSATVKIP